MRPTVAVAVLLGLDLVAAACGDGDEPARGQQGPVSSVSYHDERNDLWSDDYEGAERAPVRPNGDVVGADVRRTKDALVVTMRYDDIEPRANVEWSVSFEIHPSKGLDRIVAWGQSRYADTHRWRRGASISKVSSEDAFGQHCPRLSGTPDFDAETVTVRVPDGCFGDSRWVVVHRLEALSRPPRRSGYNHYFDNPSTGAPEPKDTPRLFEPA